jgi:hypothetical protein
VPITGSSDRFSPDIVFRLRRLRLAAAAVLGSLLIVPALLSAQPQMQGSASAEQLSLRVAPLLGSLLVVQSGPLPFASGVSDGSFADSRQAASIVVSTPVTGKLLETGLLLASTSGADSQVLSESSITQARLSLMTLLSLQADAIQSTSHLTGCGSTPDAFSRLVNARLRGPLGLWQNLPTDPAPNTVLLDLAGVRVVLNEQVSLQEGEVQSVTVNAVHISVDAVPGLGLLTGDVVLGQSHAQLGCSEQGPGPGSS